ncbi:MAG: amidase [Pirellulales bacterium]|nr:amidase [Pirellulales bacterium]
MDQLSAFSSLSEASDAVRRRELKYGELVSGLLHRIQQLDPGINAWVAVDRESALRQADAIDADLQDSSVDLHGLTIGVKDIIDVTGYATLAASPLRSMDICEQDAPIVARLRAAGAVIVGKTATTQWAFLDPPATRNPWRADRTPGGSSSGSAAAVAAQMCHVTLGTQTGGSVIRPAAYCGVFGFMFAPDVVPAKGILPLAPSLDRPGLIAGSLNDLQRTYCALASATATELSLERSHRLRIKVIRNPWMPSAAVDVREVFERAIAELPARLHVPEMQADLQDCDLAEEFDGVAAAHLCVMAFEAADVHRAAYAREPDRFAPRISELIETGLKTTRGSYEQALDRLNQWQADIAEHTASGTVLVMPSASTAAPSRETTGDPSFNSPWTAAGTPVLTAPVGLSQEGLPLGIQLIAAPGAEAHLFELARCWENGLGFPLLDQQK